MREIVRFLCLFFIFGVFGGAAQGQDTFDVRVKSIPENVKAEVFRVSDKVSVDMCVTPCEFRLFKDQEYLVRYSVPNFPYQVLLLNEEDLEWFESYTPIITWSNLDEIIKRQNGCEQLVSNDQRRVSPVKLCYRHPTIFPIAAEEPGHCMMTFAIDPNGMPTDIIARSCTHEIYKEHSIHAVENWRYFPLRINGEGVLSQRLKVKLSFKDVNCTSIQNFFGLC